MASGDFDEELASIPAAQKGPPRWMMMMGCGCLIPGFLVVAALAWSLQLFGGLVNKESAWDSLAGLIRYDDSARGEKTGLADDPKSPQDESRTPGEFELLLGGEVPFAGVNAYWFGRDLPMPFADTDPGIGPDPLSITVVKLESSQAERASMASAGTPLHEDRTYLVNGKTLRGRVVPEMVNDNLHVQLSGLGEVRGAGTVVWLREGVADPEEEGETFDLLAFFQRPKSSVSITDEEVVRFLAPFDLHSFPGSLGGDAPLDEQGSDAEADDEPESESESNDGTGRK